MSNSAVTGPIEMGLRLATRSARVGWYFGVNRLLANRFDDQNGPSRPSADNPASPPRRPSPTRAELFAGLRDLLMEDAADAAKDINPGAELSPAALPRHVGRLRAMMRDLPGTIERRVAGIHDTATAHASNDDDLPGYYAQDFHFQTGGHLTETSARLYDVQVETLFYGSADAMRRAAFRPIASYMVGRDQRKIALIDVACGTGRFLRFARRQYPRMMLSGVDLSQPYLAEAERHFDDLRPAFLHRANVEAMPVDRASQDVAVSIFLFHELPADARRAVAQDIARILKPGGIFVLIDSLQFGDIPDWDGLLEAFPERFHEPYYRQYLIEDLTEVFADAGLVHSDTRLVFLSKAIVFRKTG